MLWKAINQSTGNITLVGGVRGPLSQLGTAAICMYSTSSFADDKFRSS